MRSEHEARGELDVSCGSGGVGETEVRVDLGAVRLELRGGEDSGVLSVVPDVEGFAADGERALLAELEALGERQVPVADSGSVEDVGAGVATKGAVSDSIKLSAYLVQEVRVLDISKDIHSLSDFKRNTSEFLEQMRGSGHPVVLTINGKAELVVQDALSYQKLLERVDELEALEGINRGLADVEAGRVTPLRQFEKEFRKKRGLPSRPR